MNFFFWSAYSAYLSSLLPMQLPVQPDHSVQMWILEHCEMLTNALPKLRQMTCAAFFLFTNQVMFLQKTRLVEHVWLLQIHAYGSQASSSLPYSQKRAPREQALEKNVELGNTRSHT